MQVFIDAKFIQSNRSLLREEIVARHAVADEDPPAPDLKAIVPRSELVNKDAKDRDVERQKKKALSDHRDLIEKLTARRAAASAAIEKEWRDLRRNAFTARIAAISYAIDDGPVQHIECGRPTASGSGPFTYDVMVDERAALTELFAILDDGSHVGPSLVPAHAPHPGAASLDGCPTIVCHDAASVVAMLRKRALLTGCAKRIPRWWPLDKLPFSYSRRLQDVQQLWDDLTTRPGLETMAKGLGLPGRAAPIAGDGDVWDRIAAGAYDDVLTYCDAEVLRLRCVYRAITGLPMLATDVALLKRDLSQVTDDELVAAGYSPLVRDGAAA